MEQEELKRLRDELVEARTHITDLRIALARKEGIQKGAAWWLAGIAGLIAAWFGVTTAWQIPALVRSTAAGQAKEDAESAAKQAKKDAHDIAQIEATLRTSLANVNRTYLVLGSIDNSGVVPVPDGTTDDWDILVVPQSAGGREKPNDSYDNALLNFTTSATPSADKTKFETKLIYDWKFRNAPSKDSGFHFDQQGKAGYILRRRSIK